MHLLQPTLARSRPAEICTRKTASLLTAWDSCSGITVKKVQEGTKICASSFTFSVSPHLAPFVQIATPVPRTFCIVHMKPLA